MSESAPGQELRLGASVTGRLGLLCAGLRAGGVRVGVGDLVRAHRALAAVDPASPLDARLALRAALCSRRDDLEVFDAVFSEVFDAPAAAAPEVEEAASLALPRAAEPGAEEGRPRAPSAFQPHPVPAAWSGEELLREKDFADYSDAERAAAQHLIARLAARGPLRASRRTRPSRARGHRPDLRRTLRGALRHGGEPVELAFRSPTLSPRPLVLVCDVSGSMEAYSRMLLQYLQASVAARRRVEAFAFGTRLTRLTRELAGRDPEQALARATAAATDWAGGTRIGSALAELNREHGRRLGRGAVVVILSDGWDRGDPCELAAEMGRLARCSHSVIWLNPLKADPRYEPLTRGMRTALPHVDHFLAGNSLRSLGELADLLEGGMR